MEEVTLALDGITIANVIYELEQTIVNGRIDKIHQPLKDEIRFSVRCPGRVEKVLISANSDHPRMHLTETVRENPMKAPLFCMVLRKHIAGGKITKIYQPNFERIIILEIESANEMGDITPKRLILEIMGKHSNLILTDENDKILDSMKHISHDTSSVREVLPGKTYAFPPAQGKKNPLWATESDFLAALSQQEGKKVQAAIYQSFSGISPFMASVICQNAGIDSSAPCGSLTDMEKLSVWESFQNTISRIQNHDFSPLLLLDAQKGSVQEFSVLDFPCFDQYTKKDFPKISALLEYYYTARDNALHIRQKSHNMRHLVQTNIDRCLKKREIQLKTLEETKDMDIWQKNGELITANIYAITPNMTVLSAVDYYQEDMPTVLIQLDPTKTPAENAQHYYKKYNKAKRTLSALEIQKKQNEDELAYLESILNALDTAQEDADLNDIKNELAEAGFIHRQNTKKDSRKPKKSKPMHFISSDGFHIFVGKSNLQNDELTLKFAESTDIWLHTKEIPGSHVIIRTNGKPDDVPDQTLTEAALLAAYYSKAKQSSMVPVDYTQRKNIKKPNGAKPGKVIYYTNQTMYVTPEEDKIKSISTASAQE